MAVCVFGGRDKSDEIYYLCEARKHECHIFYDLYQDLPCIFIFIVTSGAEQRTARAKYEPRITTQQQQQQ